MRGDKPPDLELHKPSSLFGLKNRDEAYASTVDLTPKDNQKIQAGSYRNAGMQRAIPLQSMSADVTFVRDEVKEPGGVSLSFQP